MKFCKTLRHFFCCHFWDKLGIASRGIFHFLFAGGVCTFVQEGSLRRTLLSAKMADLHANLAGCTQCCCIHPWSHASSCKKAPYMIGGKVKPGIHLVSKGASMGKWQAQEWGRGGSPHFSSALCNKATALSQEQAG